MATDRRSLGGHGVSVAGHGLVYNSPVHLNGNLLCAMDVETTGLDPSLHDIIEVCILPLNADYSINKTVLPFNMMMKPRRPENVDPAALKVNKIDLVQLMISGTDPYRALDLLIRWVEKLNLPIGKKIAPLAQNFKFDYGFFIDWMGRSSFDAIFDYSSRDTMCTALFLNDVADLRVEKLPYAKTNLRYLATTENIVNPAPHRALGDCVTTAEVYKTMVQRAAFGGLTSSLVEKTIEIHPTPTLDENMDIFVTEQSKTNFKAVHDLPMNSRDIAKLTNEKGDE